MRVLSKQRKGEVRRQTLEVGEAGLTQEKMQINMGLETVLIN